MHIEPGGGLLPQSSLPVNEVISIDGNRVLAVASNWLRTSSGFGSGTTDAVEQQARDHERLLPLGVHLN